MLQRRAEGVEVASLRAYLLGTADKLASKRAYGADARRRQTFDPTSAGFAALADAGEQPDELVVAADEARRLHMLIEELGMAERALLKLRLDLGLDPPEIRTRLGLSERQYRRTAERAGRALLAQFRAFDRGDWARGKRSLLCACVMGVASETQRDRARRLVEEDPCCRAMMSELRALGGDAAALLPVPGGAVTVATQDHGLSQRAAELLGDAKAGLVDLVTRASHALPGRGEAKDRTLTTLSSVRRQAGETLMGAKSHAAHAYVRAADPTPMVGARPGAAAAILASCVAAGGGAYCAVEGVPGSLGAPIGLNRSEPASKQTPARVGSTRARATSAAPAPPVLPADPPTQTAPPAANPVPVPPPSSTAPVTPPAPVPESEFGPTPTASAPHTPSPTSTPSEPSPAPGPTGEFSP